jgi:hypothetical protein
MAGDDLFQIPAEVLVKRHLGVALTGFAQDFGDRPAAALLGPQNGDWPVILFNDDFYALLYFGQHGAKIARHVSFAHVDCGHRRYYRSCATPASARRLFQCGMSLKKECDSNAG